MLEDYRALKAADPSFTPARSAVSNPYVRVPRDLLGVAAATQPAVPTTPSRSTSSRTRKGNLVSARTAESLLGP
jgi:hypothetical protein